MKKLVVAAAAGLGLTGLGLTGLGLTGLGVASAQAAGDVAEGFHPAALKWHTCPAALVQQVVPLDSTYPVSKIVQCAELGVPLDYAHPNGQKITLQLTRLPHTGKGKAKGDLVVNPGGPGGAGAPFGASVFAQNSAAMKAAYNVIGFDPRGVGMSRPALSCDPNYNNAPRPEYGVGSQRDDAKWLAVSRAYADACFKTYGKGSKVDLLDHIKSIDSVRDLNTIRTALGQKKLDYYGASYGTYLGQTYATVFPKNVGRMVLDGNVGPKGVWYQAQLDQDYAFNTNIEYYFGWIAKHNDLYHLGTTQAQVHKFYYDLQNSLAKHPATLKDPKTGQITAVGPDELVDNVQTAGYRRSWGRWNGIASGLAAYKAKDTKTFVGTFGAQTTGGSPDNEFAVYNAVQCTDVQWPTNFTKWRDDAVKVNKQAPFETWGNVWFNAPCLYWKAPAGTPIKVGATKDLPKNILMFNASFDAATPVAGAYELHNILKGSHLIVQDGDRTHCIVHRGDPEIDTYFDAYFLNGTLPTTSLTIVKQQGDPTPPPKTSPTD